jgi:hypothetical protein
MSVSSEQSNVRKKPSNWPVIQNMFAKLAGGVKQIDVDGDAFLQQHQAVDANMRDCIVAIMQRENPHPPLTTPPVSIGRISSENKRQ